MRYLTNWKFILLSYSPKSLESPFGLQNKMTSCCVIGCFNSRAKNEREGRTTRFHSFPNRSRSPFRYKTWVDKINRANFEPSQASRVCSDHFNADDYEHRGKLKNELSHGERPKLPSLKKYAVPTQNLGWEAFEDNRPKKKKGCSRKRVASTCPNAVERIVTTPDLVHSLEFDGENHRDVIEVTSNTDCAGVQCEVGQRTLKCAVGVTGPCTSMSRYVFALESESESNSEESDINLSDHLTCS